MSTTDSRAGFLRLLDDILPKLSSEMKQSVYDVSWMSGYLAAHARKYFDDGIWNVNAVAPVCPPENFRDGMTRLLREKLDRMKDLTLDADLLKRITEEFLRFFTCCLNSNRTPEELIDGLRNDREMRDEVVEMLISRVGSSEAPDERLFLERILSGDDDMLRLLIDTRGDVTVLKKSWFSPA
ncbi:hypothetical protein ACFL1X_02420 [Candidatus Hydrogenedentota bacterium]